MLALSVQSGDYITIGSDIVVQVVKSGEVTRLAIQAPRELPIQRAKHLDEHGETPDCIQRLRKHKDPKPYRFKQSASKEPSV